MMGTKQKIWVLFFVLTVYAAGRIAPAKAQTTVSVLIKSAPQGILKEVKPSSGYRFSYAGVVRVSRKESAWLAFFDRDRDHATEMFVLGKRVGRKNRTHGWQVVHSLFVALDSNGAKGRALPKIYWLHTGKKQGNVLQTGSDSFVAFPDGLLRPRMVEQSFPFYTENMGHHFNTFDLQGTDGKGFVRVREIHWYQSSERLDGTQDRIETKGNLWLWNGQKWAEQKNSSKMP